MGEVVRFKPGLQQPPEHRRMPAEVAAAGPPRPAGNAFYGEGSMIAGQFETPESAGRYLALAIYG